MRRNSDLQISFFRFNGATTKAETSSNFPHKEVRSLGNYRDSPFVTGHSGSSTYGLKTEILNYQTNLWVQAEDYPFSNTNEYIAGDICFTFAYNMQHVIFLELHTMLRLLLVKVYSS